MTRISGKSQYVLIPALFVLMVAGTLGTTVYADDTSAHDNDTRDTNDNDVNYQDAHDDDSHYNDAKHNDAHDNDAKHNDIHNFNIIIKVKNAATHRPEVGAFCLWQVYPSFGLGWGNTTSGGILRILDVGDTSIAINCKAADGTVGTANVPLNQDGYTVIRVKTA